jgi:peptidoglycan/xylan/chitin deacetylase (PgdA/CDA1 family)
VPDVGPPAGHETDAVTEEPDHPTRDWSRHAKVAVATSRAVLARLATRTGAGLARLAAASGALIVKLATQTRAALVAVRTAHLRAALQAAALIVVTIGLVGWVVRSVGSASIPVTVDGHHTVELGGSAPVRAVLRAAGVHLRVGVLRTASGRVLDPNWERPSIFVNSRPAPASRIIRSASWVQVVAGRDAVEGVVVRVRPAGSIGGLPDVERDVWSPGSGGEVVEVVGARSGEVERQYPLAAPTPPAPEPGKTVALTFDDGPDRRNTPQVLQILRASGIKATFCVIGFEARAFPDLIAAIHADGHVLCDHTESHPYLDRIPGPAVEAQLAGPAAYLAQLVGRPAFMRAPYGALNPNVIAIAHRQGLRVLGWSVDPSDYQRPPAGTIVSRVLSQVHPGAIVLMHDGGGDRSPTIAALPSIIAALRAQGYTFVQPQVGDASAPPQTMLVGSVRFRSRSHRRRGPRPRRGTTPGSPRRCSPPGAPSSQCRESGP